MRAAMRCVPDRTTSTRTRARCVGPSIRRVRVAGAPGASAPGVIANSRTTGRIDTRGGANAAPPGAPDRLHPARGGLLRLCGRRAGREQESADERDMQDFRAGHRLRVGFRAAPLNTCKASCAPSGA